KGIKIDESKENIGKNGTSEKNEQIVKKEDGHLIILYILDSEQCASPNVFMCNMLYALMIKMRFKVPILLVFNKIDLAPIPVEWLKDYEKFMESVDEESYNGSLLKSMALHFEEFYSNFEYVGVSAETGQGKHEFFEIVEKMISSQ
ncbi:GTPase XAB1, interacts with DNA repair protein XPA, partial [Pseudoloma neurophilia]